MNSIRIGSVRRVSAIAAVTLVVAVALALSGFTDAPARADSTGTIHTTGSVNLRTGPDSGHDIIDVIPAGVAPTLHCYTVSEEVHGVDVWWSATWEGQTGYFTSYYDDSSYPTDDAIPAKYGINPCASGASGGTSSEPEPVGGEAGGIDLQMYCDSLGINARVVLGSANTPNDWACLYQPLGRPSIPGLTSFTSPSSSAVPNVVGTYVDFQAACELQYGPNMTPVLTDPDDVRSWRCFSLDLANIG